MQRTRLAAQLSTELSGIVFVLDEPGTGLHPADKAHLLDIALELRKAGNMVLLVEHDPELIARADWVIDMGPGAGRLGGEILVSGPPADAAAHPTSLTGRYLAGEGPRLRRARRPAGDDTGWVELHGLRAHNVIADLVRFPAGRLTCLTGVSGSGKSSLLGALAASVEAALNGTTTDTVRQVTGMEGFDWVAVVDQEPLGRTPRSNPATYSKAFDIVRKLFAETDVARGRGVNASWFSFNTAGGRRCETCTGYGRKLADMHFLPDVWVVCDACEGRRYTPEALEVRYQGLAIDQVLELTVAEAVEQFSAPRQLAETLGALNQVGLGYLQLGQSATELSGGEAQRLKLASAIQRGAAGRKAGLVVLDEPVSGLHPSDIQRVVDALDVLLDLGNTVVMAEHDIPVAASADWVIDLGPGAGPDGVRWSRRAPRTPSRPRTPRPPVSSGGTRRACRSWKCWRGWRSPFWARWCRRGRRRAGRSPLSCTTNDAAAHVTALWTPPGSVSPVHKQLSAITLTDCVSRGRSGLFHKRSPTKQPIGVRPARAFRKKD